MSSDAVTGTRSMFDELLWVHDHIRGELETCRRLAGEVAGGASTQFVQGELTTLRDESILWQLRLGCMRYCRFVHMHHHVEDVVLFPSLRHGDPGLSAVLDKLEADHRVVSTLLDDVEETSGGLTGDDTGERRGKLVERLERLSDVLLTHLRYEEDTIGPALRLIT